MRADVELTVTKVYQYVKRPFFFVNGQRSDAYDEIGVLEELLGDDFQEIWLGESPEYASRLLTDLVECDTLEAFEDLIEDFPDVVEDMR